MPGEIDIYTSATRVGRAQGIDFKNGTGITVTAAKDIGNSQVDVTVGITPGYGFTQFVAKTADESVTDSTLQDDDHLLFAIGASATEIWFFEAFLYVLGANTTMDFKIGLTAPSGAAARWGIAGSAGVGVNGWGVQTTGSTPSGLAETAAGPISVGTTNNASQGMNWSGWVFGGGTAGNVVLQWAQATTDAGALTVKKGSFLRVTKIAA